VEQQRQHYNVTLFVLALGCTAFALMQTMVLPALPVIQQELHTTTTWATWSLTIILLVGAVATPVLGKLGDKYGKERLLAICLLLFLLGCIGSALAWDIWSLIAFRALSGLGAGVFPLSFSIIRDEFPPEKIGVGMGAVSSMFGVGGGFGLVIAGLIIDHLNWRWIFAVGALITGIALVLVHRLVPESPVKTKTRIDVPGAILLSLTLVALLLGLSEGHAWGWTSPRVLGLFVAAIVLGAVWSVVETRVREPLIDMRTLRYRPVLFVNLTAIISGFAMFESFVLVPNFIEMGHGLPQSTQRLIDYGFQASATRAGLYLLPGSIMLLFAGPIAGRIGGRIGFKWPLAAGVLIVALSAAGICFLHSQPWHIWANQTLLGIGFGSAYAAMATLVAENVKPEEMGVATGVNTVMRLIGGVIGAQAGAAVLSTYTIPGTHGVPALRGYVITFALAAVMAAVAAVLALLIPEPSRAERRRLLSGA
jgi:EmrB/QacA subfamily drug resistance transporter